MRAQLDKHYRPGEKMPDRSTAKQKNGALVIQKEASIMFG